MNIMIPNTQFRGAGIRLAARPMSLAGATIGFLDGHGCREADGTLGMYPLMRELRLLLAERFGIADVVWQKSPTSPRSRPRPSSRN